jgi:hypothetical protein
MAERDSARIAQVRKEEQNRFGTGGAEDLSPQGGDREPEASPVQHAPSRGAEDWGGRESGPAAGGYDGVERGHGNYDAGAGSNVTSVTFDQLDTRGERGDREERGKGEGKDA